jgi:hypothetical protein
LRVRSYVAGAMISACLALVLTSCGDSSPGGTVSGTLRILEGGVMYRTVAGDGVVAVRKGGHLKVDAKVSSGHTFRLSVPSGSYRVTSSCVQQPSWLGQPVPTVVIVTPSRITIAAHQSRTVRVRCLVETMVG